MSCAVIFGFSGWIFGSRSESSLYGYVVGLIAASIGWLVIGAAEGGVTMIIDANRICQLAG